LSKSYELRTFSVNRIKLPGGYILNSSFFQKDNAKGPVGNGFAGFMRLYTVDMPG
jgi:hypothetical protein